MNKRILFVLFSFFATTVLMGEQMTTVEQLPASAKELIRKAFPNDAVAYITQEEEWFGVVYEVVFNSGSKVEFNKDGSLESVECGPQAVPDALLPAKVMEYIKAKFPNTFVVEWARDDDVWKAELNNELGLVFDSNYQFMSLED